MTIASDEPRFIIDPAIEEGLTLELAYFERHLEPGERPSIVASASRFIRPGLLIVTDRRLIFFRQPVFSIAPRMRVFPYDELDGIEAKPGWSRGMLHVRTGRRRFRLSLLASATAADEIVREVEHLRRAAAARQGLARSRAP